MIKDIQNIVHNGDILPWEYIHCLLFFGPLDKHRNPSGYSPRIVLCSVDDIKQINKIHDLYKQIPLHIQVRKGWRWVCVRMGMGREKGEGKEESPGQTAAGVVANGAMSIRPRKLWYIEKFCSSFEFFSE